MPRPISVPFPVPSPGWRVAATAVCAVWCLAGVATQARAAGEHCMARILTDVAAEEAHEEIKSKSNGNFGPITEIKVDKSTGRMVYCAKNSYCYWSNAFELISPCRIKRDDSRGTMRYFSYSTR